MGVWRFRRCSFALFACAGFASAFSLPRHTLELHRPSGRSIIVKTRLWSNRGGGSNCKNVVSDDKVLSVVTGANGYVGRAIVHHLLDEGHSTIICLVRPARVAEEDNYWRTAKKISCDVKVLPYDMLDGGCSLSAALKCADDSDCCVYHTASVFGPTENHAQTALDNVKGTEDVVNTVAKFPSCKLVLTSSMAAVRASGQTPKNGKFYSYQDWNTVSKLGENWGQSYQWSKAESERRAWALAKEKGVQMVSICPSFVFGPPSDDKMTNSFSITLVRQWVLGKSPVQSRLCVDVRDVAAAHVIAGRQPVDGNRYIVSSERRIPSETMAQSLKKVARELGIGDADSISCDTEFEGGAIKIGEKEVDAEDRLKADLCGLVCRPVDVTMASMGESLLRAS